MYVNQRDKRGAGKQGHKGEQIFVKKAKSRGFTVKKSTLQEDIHKHIDYTLLKDDKKLTFDVKAEKDDIKIYVEFLNVQGNLGWIAGECRYVAFVFSKEIIIVKRTNLIQFIKGKMDIESKPIKASIASYYETHGADAYYTMFRRYGRQDALILMPKEDLLQVKHLKWKI